MVKSFCADTVCGSVPDPDSFWGLADPHLDPLVISTDPDADPAPDPFLF